MLELSRTVRFALNGAIESRGTPRHNTFAGWPAMRGLGAHYEVVVSCRGEVDHSQGFLINIGRVDEAVRSAVIPHIERAMRERPAQDPAILLPALLAALRSLLPQAAALTWRLTPYYALSLDASNMSSVILSQQFEFAASHRLHCPSLSDEENRRLYGKCNNPAGHGHNYRLEVAVARGCHGGAGGDEPDGPTLEQLEALVADRVVQRFDHRHLNLDTEEFAALAPSVEHIASVCFHLLEDPVAAAGGRLIRTTVWETEKTSATYQPGPLAGRL